MPLVARPAPLSNGIHLTRVVDGAHILLRAKDAATQELWLKALQSVLPDLQKVTRKAKEDKSKRALPAGERHHSHPSYLLFPLSLTMSCSSFLVVIGKPQTFSMLILKIFPMKSRDLPPRTSFPLPHSPSPVCLQMSPQMLQILLVMIPLDMEIARSAMRSDN